MKFDRRVKKDFKSIDPQDVPLLKDEIAVLAENPRPGDCKKLKGKNCDFYRIRVGKYRVIYSIKDEVLLIIVVRVGHRSHIYNKL
ncbi:MAG: type II toxin-antitoxin system RelE/ParE family toxin [Prochloron sp. SP5CPC1]|nr:type II toxin-antitoxin system RelE/ParE family toxin [Candidatus Paraprochloron terpiosi SP5CPC1]